jgi:hypothetical protein
MVVDFRTELAEAKISLAHVEELLLSVLERTEGVADPELALYAHDAARFYHKMMHALRDAATLSRALDGSQPLAGLDTAIKNLRRIASTLHAQAAVLKNTVRDAIADLDPTGRVIICGENGVRDSNVHPALLSRLPDPPEPANDISGAGRRRRR